MRASEERTAVQRERDSSRVGRASIEHTNDNKASLYFFSCLRLAASKSAHSHSTRNGGQANKGEVVLASVG